MRLIGGLIVFFVGILVPTVLLNVPLLGVILAARRRLSARVVSSLLACGFVTASAWSMWRIEWFDVWRHGMPSPIYLLTGYVPSLVAFGIIGWLIGKVICRQRGDRSTTGRSAKPCAS